MILTAWVKAAQYLPEAPDFITSGAPSLTTISPHQEETDR